MCQTLGMHREANLKNDPPAVADMKRHAFWSHYMIDKNLSLCLGRKASFQDDDIDVDYFKLSDDPRQRAWDEISYASIRFSTVQGETYDRLYSIAAARAPAEQRLRTVEELAQKMVNMRNELVSVCAQTCLSLVAVFVNAVHTRSIPREHGMESILTAWSRRPTSLPTRS